LIADSHLGSAYNIEKVERCRDAAQWGVMSLMSRSALPLLLVVPSLSYPLLLYLPLLFSSSVSETRK
jgi:hypothetical protein